MAKGITDRMVDVATMLAAVAAISLAVMAFKDRLNPPVRLQPPRDSIVLAPELWTSLQSARHRIGSEIGPPSIIEFVDYECPVCASFEEITRSALRSDADLSIAYLHFPIGNHRFAMPAARAVECAAQQNLFREMHNALFRTQDSLGLISFAVLASRAGIKDTIAFNRCTKDPKTDKLIERDAQLAVQARARGTPTLVIGGVLYNGMLSERKLIELAARKVTQ